MKDFLSVGEVCKLKGISVSSLRYYEKLGLLIPSYKNPNSSYRYYSYQQMLILDFILISSDLGIPLKELKQFFNKDQIDLSSMQKLGQEIAKKKIADMNYYLKMFELWSNHTNESNKILEISKNNDIFEKKIKTRHLILLPYELEYFSLKYLEKMYSKLRKDVLNKYSSQTIEEGILFRKIRGKMKSFIFIEVEKNIQSTTFKIKSDHFLCYISDDISKTYYDILDTQTDDIILCRFFFTERIDINKLQIEVQKINTNQNKKASLH